MWLSTAVSSTIGLSEFSMRFVSALSGLLILVIVLWYSYKSYGLIPSLVGFSTLMLNNIFIWRVRSGNLDALLTLLVLIAYFLIVAKNKYKYELLGLVFGLIYLTKLTIVFFPLGIFVLTEILYEKNKLRKNILSYIKLTLIFLSIVSLWLTIGSIKVGPRFYQYFLFHSDQGVMSISLARLKTDYIKYVYYALQRRFFWLMILGIFFALINIRKKRNLVEILLAIGLILQLSFSQRNNNWYLLPSMPFWSLLIAFAIYSLSQSIKSFPIARQVLLIFICLGTLYISVKTYRENILPIINTTGPVKLKESSLVVKNLSRQNDVVIRLDQLYPTTVYYSDRKVLILINGMSTGGLVISQDDLITRIRQKKLYWIMGTSDEVAKFAISLGDVKYHLIRVNNEETIINIM